VYLHLGQNVGVPEEDVIGIFDLDNTTCSSITRKFLSYAQRAGQVIAVTDELPKSFIVCSERNAFRMRRVCNEHNAGNDSKADYNVGGNKVLLSQLSPQTLLNRAKERQGRVGQDMTGYAMI